MIEVIVKEFVSLKVIIKKSEMGDRGMFALENQKTAIKIEDSFFSVD